MLQPAGDLGLDQEPLPAHRVVGVPVEDLLERHLAVQLGVERHEHRPETASGVRSEHAEPLTVAGGRADGVGCRAVDIALLGRAVCGGDAVERRADFRVAEPGQAFGVDLPAGTAARLFSTSPPFAVDAPGRPAASSNRRAIVRVHVAAGFQVVGQASGLFRGVQVWKAATSCPWLIRPI